MKQRNIIFKINLFLFQYVYCDSQSFEILFPYILSNLVITELSPFGVNSYTSLYSNQKQN